MQQMVEALAFLNVGCLGDKCMNHKGPVPILVWSYWQHFSDALATGRLGSSIRQPDVLERRWCDARQIGRPAFLSGLGLALLAAPISLSIQGFSLKGLEALRRLQIAGGAVDHSIDLYHQALAAQRRAEQAGCADTARVLRAIVRMIGLEATMITSAAGLTHSGRTAPRARCDDGATVTAA